jgi:hypothetical protein
LKENEDEARFSQHLAMIKKDVDVEATLEKAIFNFDSKEDTIKFFKEKGFNSLIPKLNMNFENTAVVHKADHTDQRKLKEFDNVLEFFKEFDNQKELFVFDNVSLNISGEGLVCFYENSDCFFVLKTEASLLVEYLKDKTLITFDSKILYHKYFDIFEDYLFYDLKLAF